MKSTKWILFVISGASSIFAGFLLFDPSEASENFSRLAYWNILACFTGFTFVSLKAYKQDLRDWISSKANWLVVGVAILATLFLYTREGGGFKITFDEHTISNVAKSLHYDRLAIRRESSVPGIEETSDVDKRPILFHFLLATAHDIFGYDIANAFHLNAILTAILLVLILVCTANLYNNRAGWYAMLLTCCAPIIGQNASGGGIETLNLVGILVCFLLALKYSEQPHSLPRFTSLLVAVAIFSHARYESPFLVIPVITIVAINWVRIKRPQITWPVIAIPLTFIPIAWQHAFSASSDSFKQYKYDSDGFFSFSYIDENLGHAINFLTSSSNFTANSPWLSAIGLLSLFILLTLSITRRNQWLSPKRELYVAQVFAIAILAEFILILGFTYGQLDDPIVTRLGMPFILLLLICSGLSLSIIHTLKPKFKFAVHALIAFCFVYALPLYSNHSYTKNNMILKRLDWIMNWHDQLPRGNYLYISYYAQEFELNDIGNINIQRAIAQPERLKLHKELGTFDDIFVIQTYGIHTDENGTTPFLLSGNDIGPWFELETLSEISTLPFNITKISRISKINLNDDASSSDERERLLTAGTELIYDVGQKSYDTWQQSLP